MTLQCLSCSDGRTVAVKHIQKKHFTLSKTIRKEVKEVRWGEKKMSRLTLVFQMKVRFLRFSLNLTHLSQWLGNWTTPIYASSSVVPLRCPMWASSQSTAPKEACLMSCWMMTSPSTGASGQKTSHTTLHVDHLTAMFSCLFSVLFFIRSSSINILAFEIHLFYHSTAVDSGLDIACCWVDEGLCCVFCVYFSDKTLTGSDLVSVPQMRKSSFSDSDSGKSRHTHFSKILNRP